MANLTERDIIRDENVSTEQFRYVYSCVYIGIYL